MSKTSVFTTITPLPAGITRQGVIDTYHNHVEMIDLNPLVVERFQCKPPNNAPTEEYYATWYTIKDKVSYLPGGLATGSVSYHACFHDLPDGLQTHVYAPLGLDIRAKWSVGGNLPGEPKQPVEMGLGIPSEGLYIREDVRMKCNIMMISFVKKTFKESHSKLVDRLVEKAHQIEAKLANERLKGLKMIDPSERMGHGDIFIAPPPGYQCDAACMNDDHNDSSPIDSPGLSYSSTVTSQNSYLSSPPPNFPDQRGHNRNQSSHGQELLSNKKYDPNAHYDHSKHHRSHSRSPSSQYHAYVPSYPPIELPCEGPPVPPKDRHRFAAELPG